MSDNGKSEAGSPIAPGFTLTYLNQLRLYHYTVKLKSKCINILEV